MHDGSKRIILKDHVRCLPGDLGAAQAHGDTDIRFFQSRGIIYPVTGHGNDCSVILVQSDNIKFLPGADPGKKTGGKQLFFLLRCQHIRRLEITAVHNRCIGIIYEPDCKPYCLSGYRLVSRGHNNPDSCFPALLQYLFHIFPRGIDESDEP